VNPKIAAGSSLTLSDVSIGTSNQLRDFLKGVVDETEKDLCPTCRGVRV